RHAERMCFNRYAADLLQPLSELTMEIHDRLHRRVRILTAGVDLVIAIGNRPFVAQSRGELIGGELGAERGDKNVVRRMGCATDAALRPLDRLHTAPRA